MFHLYTDFFSPLFFESICSLYLFLYIIYAVSFSTSEYNFVIHVPSGIFFLQTLFILVLTNSLYAGIFSTYSFNNIFSTGFHSSLLIILLFSLCLLVLFCSRHFLNYSLVFQYEYIVFIIFSIIGLITICNSLNFIVIYLAIELQSLSFYLMSGFQWNSEYSTEAGLKYFILGSFSSCLLLFGFYIIYLCVGSTSFEVIQKLIENPVENDLLILGILFSSIAFLFKIGAVPFHMWLCDVYEGSLSSVTLFFTVIPKLVLFYFIFKFFLIIFSSHKSFWSLLVLISASLSIVIASFGALYQKKMKRLLAFSAISHTGFLLMAVACGSLESIKASIFYLIFYALMNIAFFSIIFISGSNFNFLKYLINCSGFAKRNFTLAIIFCFILLSIAGIPPLVGFYSKLLIIVSLINEYFIGIATFTILFSCLACFYYIRLIKIFFFFDIAKGFWLYCTKRELELCLTVVSAITLLFLVNSNSGIFTSYLVSLSFLENI